MNYDILIFGDKKEREEIKIAHKIHCCRNGIINRTYWDEWYSLYDVVWPS